MTPAGTCTTRRSRFDVTDVAGPLTPSQCAIAALAPTCEHCSVRIIGHGVETDGSMFCCAHCAEKAGEPAFVDRV